MQNIFILVGALFVIGTIALIAFVIIKIAHYITKTTDRILTNSQTMAEARKMEAEVKMRMAEKSNGESKHN